MAVFAFQIGDDGLLVHDFIQEDGYFFTDYIREVKERGYFGKCYVPHDISVKSFESGRTRIQTLVGAGLNPIPVPLHSVPDRINASQLTDTIGAGSIAPNARKVLAVCANIYWDDRLKVFKDQPKHNWASHAADAFGYMAVGYKQTIRPEQTAKRYELR